MHGGATGFVEEFERMQQERRWAEEFHLHQQQQIAFHHHQQQQVKGISASEEQWVNEFGQMRVGDDLMQKEREVNVQAGGSGGIDQEAIQKLLNSDNPKFRNSKFVKFLSQLNSGELELDVENNTIRTNVATQSNLDEKWAEEFDTSQSIGRNTEERWANEFHSTTADQWAQEFEEQSSQWANEFDQGVNQSQDWANEFDSIDWKEYVDNLHEAKFGETDFSAFNTKREYQFAENNPYMQSSDPYSLGLQLMRDGNLSEAVLAFEAVVQKMPEHVEAWRYLGQCHQENESENQAIAALSSAVDLDAYNLDALLMLGVSYTNDLEQSSALKHLRSWIENHPDYQSISFENHSHSDFVNVDQVLKIFNQAAQINPHDVEIQTALGVLYNISNDYDAAIECFRRCVQIRSDDASLWNKLGATQANGSRSAEAVDSYRRALELKPNYVRALANLGISFANQGLHEQAAQAYLATLTRNPSADHVWNYLRISFSSMNRPELGELIQFKDVNLFREFFEF
jgi:peroxin-5